MILTLLLLACATSEDGGVGEAGGMAPQARSPASGDTGALAAPPDGARPTPTPARPGISAFARPDTAVDTGSACTDADGDGVCAPADCDDTRADVSPGAVEVCRDGVDNDCDGLPGDCAPRGALHAGDGDAVVSVGGLWP